MRRQILIAMLLVITMGSPLVAPVAQAQRSVQSLGELMEQQIQRQVEREVLEAQAREDAASERSMRGRPRRRNKGNIQIRRGDTSGVDQRQLGEGNLQSIRVGD